MDRYKGIRGRYPSVGDVGVIGTALPPEKRPSRYRGLGMGISVNHPNLVNCGGIVEPARRVLSGELNEQRGF